MNLIIFCALFGALQPQALDTKFEIGANALGFSETFKKILANAEANPTGILYTVSKYSGTVFGPE